MWLLSGCWQPAPYTPPQPPPLDEPEPVELAAEDSAAQDSAADEPEAPPGPKTVEPWGAYTISAPASIVDDAGMPVGVLNTVRTPLTVIAEDTLRFRVKCDVCYPKTEGWIQRELVAP